MVFSHNEKLHSKTKISRNSIKDFKRNVLFNLLKEKNMKKIGLKSHNIKVPMN
jgi:hypothetical protein